jgi:hypothetical protein
MAFGGGVWLAMIVPNTGNPGISSSLDGISWTLRTPYDTPHTWESVAYGNGTFFGASLAGVTAASPDGINWQATTNPFQAVLGVSAINSGRPHDGPTLESGVDEGREELERLQRVGYPSA